MYQSASAAPGIFSIQIRRRLLPSSLSPHQQHPVSTIFHHQQLILRSISGNDSNFLIVFYVQIMPDDFVMQIHRF